jgi:hypothetical protein
MPSHALTDTPADYHIHALSCSPQSPALKSIPSQFTNRPKILLSLSLFSADVSATKFDQWRILQRSVRLSGK